MRVLSNVVEIQADDVIAAQAVRGQRRHLAGFRRGRDVLVDQAQQGLRHQCDIEQHRYICPNPKRNGEVSQPVRPNSARFSMARTTGGADEGGADAGGAGVTSTRIRPMTRRGCSGTGVTLVCGSGGGGAIGGPGSCIAVAGGVDADGRGSIASATSIGSADSGCRIATDGGGSRISLALANAVRSIGGASLGASSVTSSRLDSAA